MGAAFGRRMTGTLGVRRVQGLGESKWGGGKPPGNEIAMAVSTDASDGRFSRENGSGAQPMGLWRTHERRQGGEVRNDQTP